MDTFFRQSSMELHHERLVLRADRADGQGSSIAKLPFADELLRVRTNRKLWQAFLTDRWIMQNNPRIERQDLFRRRQKWINVDLFNPSLLSNEETEIDQQIFEFRQIYRSSAAN